jgi:hypothetical protein
MKPTRDSTKSYWHRSSISSSSNFNPR